ncbi:MAG: hypothetical protein HYW05_05100 [Candidatus Diapherotrites archaeon]|nr:hypothetical protein [Candidatus Diapherotrites archaeon]
MVRFPKILRVNKRKTPANKSFKIPGVIDERSIGGIPKTAITPQDRRRLELIVNVLVKKGAIPTREIDVNNAPTMVELEYPLGGNKHSFLVIPNKVPKLLQKYLRF